MSTNLNSNPIQISGSVTGYKAQTQAAQGTLRTLIIVRMKWSNPGNSMTLSIGDPVSGEVLEVLRSNSSGDDVIVDLTADPKIWSDFSIDAFPGSGTLFLYTK